MNMRGWSQRVHVAIALAMVALAASAADLPTSITAQTTPVYQSADTVSSWTVPQSSGTGQAKALMSLTTKTAAVSGFVMVFDATSLPSNGAITPCASSATARPCQMWCLPIVSDGTRGYAAVQWMSPLLAQTGVLAAFSSTGCDTLTASATAKFQGQGL